MGGRRVYAGGTGSSLFWKLFFDVALTFGAPTLKLIMLRI